MSQVSRDTAKAVTTHGSKKEDGGFGVGRSSRKRRSAESPTGAHFRRAKDAVIRVQDIAFSTVPLLFVVSEFSSRKKFLEVL